jgi:hypothetical protein
VLVGALKLYSFVQVVEGLVHTGEQHQRQCKMLNPVLDVVHLRRLGIPQTRLDFYQSNPRTWGQVPLFKGG